MEAVFSKHTLYRSRSVERWSGWLYARCSAGQVHPQCIQFPKSAPFSHLRCNCSELSVRAQDQLALKIVLPEKLSAIAVDPRGKYCAGATAQGRIFLWEARTFVKECSPYVLTSFRNIVDRFRDNVQLVGCTLPPDKRSPLHPRCGRTHCRQ